jgi:hypothetical protein
MSEYIGGGVTLLLVVAAIVGVLFVGGNGGAAGDGSIIPEAVAAAPVGADYGWKGATPQYDDRGEVAEFY